MEHPFQLPPRFTRVLHRAENALNYLKEHGPSVLTAISAGIGEELQLTRYALVVLRQEAKAHISAFLHLAGDDDIRRYIAQYSAGDGTDAILPYLDCVLDFESTKHLQPHYVRWTRSRQPLTYTPIAGFQGPQHGRIPQ